jgi:phospholipid/cholesterol/gamma-HCH transport system ATP-binding protein
MITAIDVIKSFSGKPVLKGVRCELKSGNVNLIIGTSGSGKTVFMKCLIGLFDIDQGQILYDGEDFAAMNDAERKHLRTQIGMLFQGSALFDSLTVEDNVRFPLDMFTKMTMAQKRIRVNEVLARVNLVDANKKFPSEISGGMKKRVALARAIVMNPKYLFCDEPNSGLDPQTSLVIDKLIMDLTKEYNMTTVINTHDMNTVMESGDHIVYLYQGEKEWEGSNKDIIYSTNQRLNAFIFASEFLRDAKEMRMLEAKKINR